MARSSSGVSEAEALRLQCQGPRPRLAAPHTVKPSALAPRGAGLALGLLTMPDPRPASVSPRTETRPPYLSGASRTRSLSTSLAPPLPSEAKTKHGAGPPVPSAPASLTASAEGRQRRAYSSVSLDTEHTVDPSSSLGPDPGLTVDPAATVHCIPREERMGLGLWTEVVANLSFETPSTADGAGAGQEAGAAAESTPVSFGPTTVAYLAQRLKAPPAHRGAYKPGTPQAAYAVQMAIRASKRASTETKVAKPGHIKPRPRPVLFHSMAMAPSEQATRPPERSRTRTRPRAPDFLLDGDQEEEESPDGKPNAWETWTEEHKNNSRQSKRAPQRSTSRLGPQPSVAPRFQRSPYL